MIKITNGEKIISDFPYIEVRGQDEVFTTIQIDTTGTGTPIIVYTDWWNAEYKEPSTQERQAESDKFDAAFQDGYNNGYAQARFDYEQKPRKGHWIYDYTSADGHRTYHCSECGCYLQPKHSEPLNSFKWCSLCGADMREVKE